MTIQLNTDKNVSGHNAFGIKLDSLLSEELSRLIECITSFKAQLSDESSFKDGVNDKKYLLEARVEGRQPIAITGLGSTYDLAINTAIDKLTTCLYTILEHIRNNHRA